METLSTNIDSNHVEEEASGDNVVQSEARFYVGIITYNRADRLANLLGNEKFWAALKSVNGTVVFINPSSTDSTAVLLESIKKRNAVVRHTQDVNLVACRMRMTDLVFGLGLDVDDIFLFLDDDAIVEDENVFMYIRKIFDEHPEVGVAGQEAFFMDPGLTRFVRADKMVPCPVDTVSGSVHAVRGMVILEGVEYNQDYQPCWHEDTDFNFQAKEHGWTIWGFPRDVGIHHDSHRKTPDTVYYRNMAFLQARWGNKGLTEVENEDGTDCNTTD